MSDSPREPTTSSTGCSHTISGMYERWTLDCVVEVVMAVAVDFVNRPRQYRLVPESIADVLQAFWYQSGVDPGLPDLHKRERVFGSLIGGSDGKRGDYTCQFHRDAAAVMQRADDFTNRVFSTGEGNLRQAFRDEVITFRSYLETLEDNSVVEIGDRQTRSVFDKAVEVLLDPTVCGVFGHTPASVSDWPLAGSYDKNGAQVLEAVTTALETSTGVVSQSQFVVVQRIGSVGAASIDGVLDADLTTDSSAQDLDRLIHLTYSWKTSRDALTL